MLCVSTFRLGSWNKRLHSLSIPSKGGVTSLIGKGEETVVPRGYQYEVRELGGVELGISDFCLFLLPASANEVVLFVKPALGLLGSYLKLHLLHKAFFAQPSSHVRPNCTAQMMFTPRLSSAFYGDLLWNNTGTSQSTTCHVPLKRVSRTSLKLSESPLAHK